MSDRDFKKFLEEVQVSAVSDAPMPRMSDKKPAAKAVAKSATMAGSKRPAAKAGVSQKAASAAQASKRSRN